MRIEAPCLQAGEMSQRSCGLSLRSFKTKLELNNRQRTLFAKHAGTSRHAYNWGLAQDLEAEELALNCGIIR